MSVDMNESEAMKSYNLDEIDKNPNHAPLYLTWTIGIGIYKEWS